MNDYIAFDPRASYSTAGNVVGSWEIHAFLDGIMMSKAPIVFDSGEMNMVTDDQMKRPATGRQLKELFP